VLNLDGIWYFIGLFVWNSIVFLERYTVFNISSWPPPLIPTQGLPAAEYKDTDDDGTTPKPAVWLPVIPEQWLSYCYIYIYNSEWSCVEYIYILYITVVDVCDGGGCSKVPTTTIARPITAVSSLNVRLRSHNNNLRLRNRSIFGISDELRKVHKFVSRSRIIKNESYL